MHIQQENLLQIARDLTLCLVLPKNTHKLFLFWQQMNFYTIWCLVLHILLKCALFFMSIVFRGQIIIHHGRVNKITGASLLYSKFGKTYLNFKMGRTDEEKYYCYISFAKTFCRQLNFVCTYYFIFTEVFYTNMHAFFGPKGMHNDSESTIKQQCYIFLIKITTPSSLKVWALSN